MRLPPPIAAGKCRVKEMALAVEWLPEEWPDGIPSLKQLLVVAPLQLLSYSSLELKLQPLPAVAKCRSCAWTSLPCAPLLARADFGPAREDGRGQAAARSEFAAHDAPFGLNGGDDVAEDFVDGVFVEDAQAAVGEEIHFQGLQLDAVLLRHVLDGDGAEVGETGLGADGGVFGKARGNNVAGKLIGPGFERGQFCVDAGAGVLFGVVGHACSSNPLYRGAAPC